MISSFRYVSWIAIISSLIGSLLMFIIGAQKSYRSVETFLYGNTAEGPLDTATLYVIKSLDAFLIAFVLYIFAIGIYKLFIDSAGHDNTNAFDWIKIDNINHLKKILAEVIIVILFVKFLEVVIVNMDSLKWELMIFPASIVLLAFALKLLDLADKK
jgi:uncharacterized membrane protein YqhA